MSMFKQHAVKLLFLTPLFLLLSSCAPKVEEIQFGHDGCHFCHMTIVERQFPAQWVSQKGKNYKFDAIECLASFLEGGHSEEDALHMLVTDYLEPSEMMPAKDAVYLVSENVQSPMGAHLAAVKDKETALSLQKELGGELYSWEAVKKHLAKRDPYEHGH